MVALFALVLSGFAGHAIAAGGAPDPMPAEQKDPVVEKVDAMTARGDWAGAAALLKDAVAKAPANAQYHNLLAYTTRRGPRPDMDLVFREYAEALRLRPDYRGAHEYVGEAWLMVGNLPKAKEHLATLDRLCTFGCEEYTLLKNSIAAYEKNGGKYRGY